MHTRSPRLLLPVFTFAIAFSQLAAQNVASAVGQFAYTGNDGPGFWSKFDARCAATSTRQSPIDIVSASPNILLKPLDLSLQKAQVELVNPGYTVQANVSGTDYLTLNGDRYSLLQFHFHTLSEHTIAGTHGIMEMHLVFANEQQQYAVIGVIFRLGETNAFLQQLIDAGLPQTTLAAPTKIEDLDFDRALTDTSAYYTYAGSLTTPPCSENVTWLLLKQWAQLSPAKYEAFRNILGNDFRPQQNLSGRKVQMTVEKQPW